MAPDHGSAQLSWTYDSFGNYQGQTVSGSTSASFMQFPPCDYSGNSRNQIGNPTNFYRLLAGEQVSELDGSGDWLRSTAYGAGREIAAYDASGLHSQFTDWLGTRRAMANGSGQLEETCRSLPYGDNQQCTSPGGSGVSNSLGNDHHVTGKERDAESGLDYFGARHYGSSMGRFMSPDWSAKIEPVPYWITRSR